MLWRRVLSKPKGEVGLQNVLPLLTDRESVLFQGRIWNLRTECSGIPRSDRPEERTQKLGMLVEKIKENRRHPRFILGK